MKKCRFNLILAIAIAFVIGFYLRAIFDKRKQTVISDSISSVYGFSDAILDIETTSNYFKLTQEEKSDDLIKMLACNILFKLQSLDKYSKYNDEVISKLFQGDFPVASISAEPFSERKKMVVEMCKEHFTPSVETYSRDSIEERIKFLDENDQKKASDIFKESLVFLERIKTYKSE